MNILITGVNGFIGSHLARHLSSLDLGSSGSPIKVFGCSIEAAARTGLEQFLSGYHRLALGEALEEGQAARVFKEMNVVVHCAYSYDRRNIAATNIDGTKQWFQAAKQHGVQTQVFLTSYSAKPGSRAVYGLIKYELERFFIEAGQPVIRPGLVLGDGGIFARMSKVLKNFPFIPLLDGGAYEVPIIPVEALCQVIAKVIVSWDKQTREANRSAQPGPVVVGAFQEQMVSMKQLLQEMKLQLGARCLFIPIPSVLPLFFLKTLEALHLPFPIKSGSIVALKENQALSIPSSLAAMGIAAEPLAEILGRLSRSRIK